MCTSCSKRMDRCFITGELCTHQLTITRAREENYRNGIASAFVVMPFTDMADATYKWNVRNTIKDLKQYFTLIRKEGEHEIRCYASATQNQIYQDKNNEDEGENFSLDSYEKEDVGTERYVRDIDPVRADQDVMFGYVICNRVCQQIQIADIVVVDVSRENPNVFYEFGLAVALGKMIVPICFEDDYFRYQPKGVDGDKSKNDNSNIKDYPWVKTLYDHFALNCRDFRQTDRRIVYESSADEGTMGTRLAGGLAYTDNLITYTSHGFQDKQFGRQIIDFYKIVSYLNRSDIFSGDRIAILGQHRAIEEMNKEDPNKAPTSYKISDLLLLGVNQASNSAESDALQAEAIDKLLEMPSARGERDSKTTIDILLGLTPSHVRWLEEYRKNKSFLVYPTSPTLSKEVELGLYEDLSSLNRKIAESEDVPQPYTYFHAMIAILKYADQIVVDTQHNDILSLFWLGVAHGFGAYAVRVLREFTSREREENKVRIEKEQVSSRRNDLISEYREPRSVFDVSGLWTAVLRSDDIDLFFAQLSVVQHGIARHRKLLPMSAKHNTTVQHEKNEDKGNNRSQNLAKARNESTFESYYRRKFWLPLLSKSQLAVDIGMIPSKSDPSKPSEDVSALSPRRTVGQWDLDTVSLLTNYISSHTMIGEYKIEQIEYKKPPQEGDPLSEEFEQLLEQYRTPSREFEENYSIQNCHSISIGDNTVHPKAMGILLDIIARYEPDDLHLRLVTQPLNCSVAGYKTREVLTIDPKQGKFALENSRFREDPKGFSARAFMSIPREGKESHVNPEELIWMQPNSTCADQNTCKNAGQDSICKWKNAEHHAYAQLIIYRNAISTTTKERGKTIALPQDECFHVLIAGGSGPATYALSSLFVDEDHKRFVNKRNTEDEYLLTKLQKKIRMKLITQFRKLFEDECIRNKNSITEMRRLRLSYVIADYLNHLLSRYFVPIITQKANKGIRNSLWYFLHTMQNTEVFGSKSELPILWDTVEKCLAGTLDRLVGVEVLFKVDMTKDEKSSPENRKAETMEIAEFTMDGEKQPAIYMINKK